jgi:hypothetical protein
MLIAARRTNSFSTLNPSHASPQSLKEAANQQRGSLDYFANKWKGISMDYRVGKKIESVRKSIWHT